ncbi:MAG: hypothetical protein IJQ95_06785 [Paludibacteraceae bacterium]|nr:hypothetical protein [Paludibacteraceae bacterium]
MKKTLLIATMAISTVFAQAQAWQTTFKLCNVYITSENVNDLATVANVTSGTIEFNNSTNTLTLTDVNWTRPTSGTWYFIKSEDTGTPLNVVFKGTNILDNNSMQRAILHVDPSTEIRVSGGSPKSDNLTIRGGNGLNIDQGLLTIKNLALTFEDNIWTIGGYGPSSMGQLIINFCDITAHPSNNMFDDLTSFQMIDCVFKTPADAVYDETQHAVVSEGVKLKDIDVKIIAKTTGIPQVHAQKQAEKVIVNGQLLIERNGELFNATGARVK